jgi:peptide/nickel transport system permease protein
MVATFNRQNGFDDPLIVQFGRFLNGLLHLDFGESLYQHRPALDAVLSAYPDTLIVGGITIAVALVVGVLLGAAAAVFRYRGPDRVVVAFSLAMASAPQFWVALIGILVFATTLRILPTSGLSGASSYVLPVVTLALLPTGVIAQVVRGAMIEALGSSYVLRSRALGLGSTRVTLGHALRNSALPVITIAGDQAAQLINGVVIVSSVFALPGIGSLVYTSVLNRDYPVIQACIIVTGIGVLFLNFAIDIFYTLVDPRVRVG